MFPIKNVNQSHSFIWIDQQLENNGKKCMSNFINITNFLKFKKIKWGVIFIIIYYKL